jgi:hypothetical protein
MSQISLHTGELSWQPKTVILNGVEYPAPLDLLPILVRAVWIEELKERAEKRKKSC